MVLTDVPVNHLVALRDVTGKQTNPREAEQIDQFELPVCDEDFCNWLRQGPEAAAVSPIAKIFLSQITSLSRASTGMVRLCRYKTVSCVPVFAGSRKKDTFTGRCSDPLPVTGPVDARVESLHALPLERHEGLSGVNVGLSLICHILPSVLLVNSRLEPLYWASMLWMCSRVSLFECSVFTWRCSRVFVLPSIQRLLLLSPASRLRRKEGLASAPLPMPLGP